MITARYTTDGSVHNLTVAGHANYDEYGRDIVCAGVSALVQALIGWIEESFYSGYIDVNANGGEVEISCEGGDDVAAVFNLATIGLMQIADSYPDHVQINITGMAG